MCILNNFWTVVVSEGIGIFPVRVGVDEADNPFGQFRRLAVLTCHCHSVRKLSNLFWISERQEGLKELAASIGCGPIILCGTSGVLLSYTGDFGKEVVILREAPLGECLGPWPEMRSPFMTFPNGMALHNDLK